MSADERKFYRLLVQRLICCANVSGYINTSVSVKNAAKRVVMQRRIKRVAAENRDPFMKTPLYFLRHFPILFLEAAMKKDSHRRLRYVTASSGENGPSAFFPARMSRSMLSRSDWVR